MSSTSRKSFKIPHVARLTKIWHHESDLGPACIFHNGFSGMSGRFPHMRLTFSCVCIELLWRQALQVILPCAKCRITLEASSTSHFGIVLAQVEFNLWRAVNRQPWFPRKGLAEPARTRSMPHAHTRVITNLENPPQAQAKCDLTNVTQSVQAHAQCPRVS